MASVAKLLIAKGANVNAKTQHGVSPLDLAAGNGEQKYKIFITKFNPFKEAFPLNVPSFL